MRFLQRPTADAADTVLPGWRMALAEPWNGRPLPTPVERVYIGARDSRISVVEESVAKTRSDLAAVQERRDVSSPSSDIHRFLRRARPPRGARLLEVHLPLAIGHYRHAA